MLLKNFKVVHQILNDVTKNSVPVARFGKGTSQGGKWFGERPRYNNRLTLEEYKKKLKQCPKLSNAQICKKLFSKPESKCEATTASEDYLKARQLVGTRIQDMIKFVESESGSIATDLKNRSRSSKIDNAARLRELFEKTTSKLDKLMSMDVSYGCWMRRETLLLNDEMRRSFDALERAFALNAEHIGLMLKNLRCDVSSRVERAERSIVACRKHDAPSVFAECVKEQLEEATKLLDRTNEEARLKLGEIAKFREAAVTANEKTTTEVIETNRKRATEMSDYLDRCIVQLKKSNKSGSDAKS